MNASKQRRSRIVAMLWLGAAVLLAGSVSQLAAQERGDAKAGRTLAETWCSSCHVVVPAPPSGTSTGAPTFAAIARMPSMTQESLRTFLQTPHGRMPDLHLSTGELDNLTAYIISLQRG